MKQCGIIFISLFFTTLGLAAQDQALGDEAITALSEINSSSLVYYNANLQKYQKAPELAMKAKITIDGMIVRVSFTQDFTNPLEQWLEGTYVFPLPETAAVCRFKMTVGNRLIEGIIKEKAEAKQIYEEAKASGKKAALLEQDRPNIFTTSVANIPPREKITVELEYQQALEPVDGEYRLRFPLVITPRYDPSQKDLSGVLTNGNSVPDSFNSNAHIPVMFNLEPLLGGGKGKRNPVDITVDLEAGFPIKAVASLYHKVSAVMRGAEACSLSLASGPVPADRDFVLAWKPEAESKPETSVFIEKGRTDSFALLMIQPPALSAANFKPIPRETIYIIDISGSMEGSSITQARESLLAALKLETGNDLFNIIAFNDSYRVLYPECRIMTKDNHDEAVRFVYALQADGGTEMMPALTRALLLPRDRSRLGQVIFMTDGAVSNEGELFSLIRQKLDDRRFFTIGIGSAPNSYFMRKAAAAGKGTFTYVGSLEEVESVMKRLFEKISSPVMQNINVVLQDTAGEIWPQAIPDLYAGEPVVVLARLTQANGKLVVKGEYAGQLWSRDINLTQGKSGEGIGTLWARKKIDALLDQSVEGVADGIIRMQVLPIALEFSVLSPYTSFVAVEQVIAKPAEEKSASGNVPPNPPEGWQPPQSMTNLAGTATTGEIYLIFGFLLLFLSLAALGVIKLGSK